MVCVCGVGEEREKDTKADTVWSSKIWNFLSKHLGLADGIAILLLQMLGVWIVRYYPSTRFKRHRNDHTAYRPFEGTGFQVALAGTLTKWPVLNRHFTLWVTRPAWGTSFIPFTQDLSTCQGCPPRVSWRWLLTQAFYHPCGHHWEEPCSPVNVYWRLATECLQ